MSRIIAGSLASRRIITPPGSNTRPTTDQVREAVFALLASWLSVVDVEPGQQLAQMRFLDLYAGSGAVGLEAYSRGASVTWVETTQCGIIKKNIAALAATGQVMAMDVARFLRRTPTPFDIVWMDPPYETSSVQVDRIVQDLEQRGWVKDGGYVLVERSVHSSTVEFPGCFTCGPPRRYGDTMIFYGEKVKA